MSKLSDLLKNQFDITDSGYPADARALKTLNDRIDSIEPTDINVVDNLTSTSSTDALSAKQGKVLNDKIEATLNGTNYLIVYGTGNPTQNAAELQAAYDSVTSGTDRFTIIVAPGHYAGTFNITKEKVDIVSLTGNADVMLNGVSVTANNVYLKGLNCGENKFDITEEGLVNLVVEKCIGGVNSFGDGLNLSGKFIECIGGTSSFGASLSGTCIRCIGGAGSFGYGDSVHSTARIEYCKIVGEVELVWSDYSVDEGGHISFCINTDGSAAANK